MLNVTRLLCGTPTPGDHLRYGQPTRASHGSASAKARIKPVVVWNVTRRCNLRCVHCYASATNHAAPDELTHDEAVVVVNDLTNYGVPVILFSGGEPLLRTGVFDLMQRASQQGIQSVLSSNGTLVDDETVRLLRLSGVQRVGISLDGLEATNDRFRGEKGAFTSALSGVRRLVDAGFRVSLRFTVTKYNAKEVPDIFQLTIEERIPRLCIYHLAYAGRGRGLLHNDLSHEERRNVVEYIFARTLELHRQGVSLEVLTVDNHADGAHLLLWAQRHTPERVAEIHRLLKANGGNGAGRSIGCIDERGFVHPDQFWRSQRLGNIRERPFSQIWEDETTPLLHQLRNRGSWLPSRCRSCRFFEVCNGNLRARAEAATGDPWGADPACYLTDEEISVAQPTVAN